MTSWLKRWRAPSDGPPTQSPKEPQVRKASTGFFSKPEPNDPNAPERRLQLHQKCIYERLLPGNAFVSAHVNRLQHGYYESSAIHEPTLENIYFVSVHFVFHPYNTREHRFKSAGIRVSVHGDAESLETSWYNNPPSNPRILKHAPELMYGAVSPENLQWNFSLSSSLGVSQAPLAATVNPSGGVHSSYKVYDMMSIQGSLRTLQSPLGPKYDVEDGMAVWTLQENLLQRSGLPREFDFVMLVYKPNDVKDVFLSVDVDAAVESWFGQYPQWYMNLSKHQPSQDYLLDLNTDIGQKFLPSHPVRGFNFADLPHPLDDYVAMPGTTYPTNDTLKLDDPTARRPKTFNQNPVDRKAILQSQHTIQQPRTPVVGQRSSKQGSAASRHSWAPETLNVRVMLEPSCPRAPSPRRYSGSPINSQEQVQHRSIRRTRSRSGLKEYGAQQALQEIAREALNTG
ncbi:uncharacterized protein BDR25DRAFT_253845 [Lindgomyces ingoldianus]|uniref:Uncharacterized protein n=1 Tax=Lindgomyces ingoldianus TaxID=673940 RepID=A0ACB6R9Z9_9PLEO|nr:uncharacterized protein BDR25DRAFT_253845 [Lindgomyces ingoldianus]KAF2476148.1 hypothetical protein BDR25DRAFT_253845 [Lindgomyces ingoldianus]